MTKTERDQARSLQKSIMIISAAPLPRQLAISLEAALDALDEAEKVIAGLVWISEKPLAGYKEMDAGKDWLKAHGEEA